LVVAVIDNGNTQFGSRGEDLALIKRLLVALAVAIIGWITIVPSCHAFDVQGRVPQGVSTTCVGSAFKGTIPAAPFFVATSVTYEDTKHRFDVKFCLVVKKLSTFICQPRAKSIISKLTLCLENSDPI